MPAHGNPKEGNDEPASNPAATSSLVHQGRENLLPDAGASEQKLVWRLDQPEYVCFRKKENGRIHTA